MTFCTMPVWLGIDGTNWVHALYHALRGRDVFAAFCSRAQLLAELTHASVVVVAFDRPSFRHVLLPTYKENRQQKEDALLRMVDEAPTKVHVVGQPIAEDGYEADDCLATLAAIAVVSGARSVLASADKDLFQVLVDGRVSQLRKFATREGRIADAEWMTAVELEISERWAGLRPSSWIDYQCLVGEPGDNVRGCPGWGETTAREALAVAGSIDVLLENPWAAKCTQRQMAKLQTWAKDNLAPTRDLLTLRRDVPAVADALR